MVSAKCKLIVSDNQAAFPRTVQTLRYEARSSIEKYFELSLAPPTARPHGPCWQFLVWVLPYLNALRFLNLYAVLSNTSFGLYGCMGRARFQLLP